MDRIKCAAHFWPRGTELAEKRFADVRATDPIGLLRNATRRRCVAAEMVALGKMEPREQSLLRTVFQYVLHIIF